MIALDIGAFLPLAEFERRTERLVEQLKATAPAAESAEVLVPGELEARRAVEQCRDGIDLAPATVADLAALGAELRVPGAPWRVD
jgi:LDH2 family malate/lactate/ureidoglycolate dehydrogenase